MASNNKNEGISLKSRRSNKPLMEKRRRERINKSLNSLKELVLVAENRDMSKFSKLEKADILEMTVRHLKSLHENSELMDKSNEFLSKYRAGFERCTSELENYLHSVQTLPPENISRIIYHLKSYSETFTKDSVTLSSRGNVHRVKATIDSSVLKADVLRHEDTLNSSSNSPLQDRNVVYTSRVPETESHSVKFEVYIPNWSSVTSTHAFPPSPPDSSRCSSSPDSLRGSPRNIFEHVIPQGQLPDSPSVIIPSYHNETVKKDVDSAVHQVPACHTNTPLNLTIPQNSSKDSTCTPLTHDNIPLGNHSSYPVKSIKQEPGAESLSQASGRCTPERSGKRRLNHAFALEASKVPRRHSLNANSRPAPYPKKDAVKRYQSQNPSVVDSQQPFLNHNESLLESHKQQPNIHFRDDVVSHSSSHWRPW